MSTAPASPGPAVAASSRAGCSGHAPAPSRRSIASSRRARLTDGAICSIKRAAVQLGAELKQLPVVDQHVGIEQLLDRRQQRRHGDVEHGRDVEEHNRVARAPPVRVATSQSAATCRRCAAAVARRRSATNTGLEQRSASSALDPCLLPRAVAGQLDKVLAMSPASAAPRSSSATEQVAAPGRSAVERRVAGLLVSGARDHADERHAGSNGPTRSGRGPRRHLWPSATGSITPGTRAEPLGQGAECRRGLTINSMEVVDRNQQRPTPGRALQLSCSAAADQLNDGSAAVASRAIQ